MQLQLIQNYNLGYMTHILEVEEGKSGGVFLQKQDIF